MSFESVKKNPEVTSNIKVDELLAESLNCSYDENPASEFSTLKIIP
jgi:hypothetical protein